MLAITHRVTSFLHIVELTPKQSEILRMRFQTLDGEWREKFVQHTRASSADDPVCVFYGTTEGEVARCSMASTP